MISYTYNCIMCMLSNLLYCFNLFAFMSYACIRPNKFKFSVKLFSIVYNRNKRLYNSLRGKFEINNTLINNNFIT